MYGLKFHRNAEKSLKKIVKGDKNAAQRIADEIRALKTDPRPNGIKKISNDIYRLRVGEYRVIYAIFDHCETLVVGKIERRSEDTYKDIESIEKRTREILKRLMEK